MSGDNGFQPQRDYLALQPFESIDTASGNVILAFTDLALSGNAGRELRFDRVFNNMVTAANEPKWRLSIGGMPLRVVQPDISSSTQIADTIDGNRQLAPRLHMPDGSIQLTTFMVTPDPGVASTIRWVSAPNFWKYDRESRTLYATDGRTARYDAATGLLVELGDPFGNAVTLAWGPGSLVVTQYLGGGESRVVTLGMNDSTRLPLTMTYAGRTWRYTYDATYGEKLARVQPPPGQPWILEYDAPAVYSRIEAVTTPQGRRGRARSAAGHPTPEHAMRSQAVEVGGTPMHRPGTILGKALQALPSGTGEILVLLTLQ